MSRWQGGNIHPHSRYAVILIRMYVRCRALPGNLDKIHPEFTFNDVKDIIRQPPILHQYEDLGWIKRISKGTRVRGKWVPSRWQFSDARVAVNDRRSRTLDEIARLWQEQGIIGGMKT